MINRLRNREKGFTLIELLIVVAIIGIIAALLIPNFLDALQKAKQKRTVADVRNAGTALFSWLTDQVGAAAAGAAAGPNDCNGTATTTAFYATAVPANAGSTGNRGFAVNTSGTIWENVAGGGAAAPTEAQMGAAPKATVHPIQ